MNPPSMPESIFLEPVEYRKTKSGKWIAVFAGNIILGRLYDSKAAVEWVVTKTRQKIHDKA